MKTLLQFFKKLALETLPHSTMAISRQSFIQVTIASLLFMVGKNVYGAVSIDNIVFCSDIVPGVCATASYATPSPAAFPNGTVFYIGGYYSTYTITQGLNDGDETTGDPSENAGIEVTVFRDDDDKCEVSITVDGKTSKCNSCRYCGSDSYSVNCTNLKNGRSFDVCESTVPDSVFFPLTASALENPYEAALSSLWIWLWNSLRNLLSQTRSMFA
jgi:hypothetical protein